ncbi:programmed cell death 1 ligand 1-like [Embiotoca jacksoni]|uniref:programmed cell death 1 ligand 1-like n=1 Tax=Embiotoca jacksoni TaxID=100190 RepID=UPI003703A436
MQVSMDWTLVLVLQVMFQPSLSVLFTVEAERTMYVSEFGENIVMGCRFYPRPSHPQHDLKVAWLWVTPTTAQDVIQIDNGVKHSSSQKYQGRVEVLTEELKDGWAKLKISGLRINDSGNYQCLVQTGKGADYKTINLSVRAPYKSVIKRIEKAAEGDEVLLTCQSEGYPQTSVVWQDEHQQRRSPNITAVSTPEQLFKITSQIQVSSSETNKYTCNFTNDGYTATFHIPGDLPTFHAKSDALIIVFSIAAIMVIIIVGVLTYGRRKGCNTSSIRNCLAGGREHSVSAAAYEDKDNEAAVF